MAIIRVEARPKSPASIRSKDIRMKNRMVLDAPEVRIALRLTRKLYHSETSNWGTFLFEVVNQKLDTQTLGDICTSNHDHHPAACTIKAAGIIFTPIVGHNYELTGQRVEHPKFGLQFSFTASRRLQHKLLDRDGNPVPIDHKVEAVKFLQSKLKKNAVAELLDTLSSKDHERLPEIIKNCEFPEELIPQDMQSKIAHDYFIFAHYESVSSELLDLGIGQTWHTRIISEWGEEAINVIKENPFAMMNIPGMGFKRIDAIIDKFNLAKDDPRRIIASYISILEEHSRNGHTWTDSKVLQRDAARMANFSVMKIMPDPKNYDDCGFLVENAVGEDGRVRARVYLHDNHKAEKFIAEFLTDRIFSSETGRSVEPQNIPTELNDRQQEAFRRGVEDNLTVITGGPGTGKTFLIKHLVDYLKFTNVAILAPTGKAAARITESTGYDASTIHRYLHLIPRDDRPGTAAAKIASALKRKKRAIERAEAKAESEAEGGEGSEDSEAAGRKYQFELAVESGGLIYPENPAPHKIFIIDEVSMVDTWVLWRFLQAISPDSKIILVGDADQLPSIGSGNILADIMKVILGATREKADSYIKNFTEESQDNAELPNLRAHVCELTEPVRVDAYSTIFSNTQAIRAKSSAFNYDEDFSLHPVSESVEIVAQVVKLVENSHRSTKIPHPRPAVTEQIIDFNKDKEKDSTLTDPFNFEKLPQVLTPTNRGPVSVNGLNTILQAILNLHGDRIPGTKFRIGDKIMCVRNDYTLNMLNGDTGIICGYFTPTDTQFKEPCLAVKFFNYTDVHYLPKDAIGKLTLAYASTVHKAQGSEYPHVIIALHASQTIMLNRNLFYTAVTRAKEKVDLVGDRGLFNRAVHVSMPERRTTIKERFAEIITGVPVHEEL